MEEGGERGFVPQTYTQHIIIRGPGLVVCCCPNDQSTVLRTHLDLGPEALRRPRARGRGGGGGSGGGRLGLLLLLLLELLLPPVLLEHGAAGLRGRGGRGGRGRGGSSRCIGCGVCVCCKFD